MKKLVLNITLVVLSLSAIAQKEIVWSAPVDVAASSFGKTRPVVRLINDSIPVVIWSSLGLDNTYFSSYNGSSFSSPTQLNPSSMEVVTYDWAGPEMATSGENIFVVLRSQPWVGGHVYLVKSNDGGANWSDTIKVDSLGSGLQPYYPAIAASSDTDLSLVFMHHDGSDNDPQYVTVVSTDGGNTFRTHQT